ncbi:sodium:proton antiporter [Tumebacillus permanentifrigoris]|uniref:Nickel/cobalt efflux system n=1 Tax=Tumebacillus permanentifrigoris TaxID=378543 RepID=A0A316DB23_9BACL|nr:sodium:proton antiporter [Tumebacillus permanentifrigoris]PWK15002.1 high-affinity nickel-transport protein [Tumebacillus permanentifrigoris]
MEDFSLLALVFVLGLRHGLDADHLACIDGLTRYNLREGRKTARWVGTLFSFGHGLVVATVGVILSMFSKEFTFPDYFDTVVTWVSVCSLALIGCLNAVNLVRSRSEQSDFKLRGIKGRFIPRIVRETTNPFMIILIGGVFALAADTVSQTSVWALASGNADNPYLPVALGLTFMAGMMLTDTIDSLIAYRMLAQSGQLGRTASKAMGWVIVALAFGVSFYEAFTYFYPWAELDFEVVGVVIFIMLLICFGGVRFLSRNSSKRISYR